MHLKEAIGIFYRAKNHNDVTIGKRYQ